MKHSKLNYLALFSILWLVSGCVVKEYTTYAEYYALPSDEQIKLCKEWRDRLATESNVDVTFYDAEPWRKSSNLDSMTTSAAQLGNDMRIISNRRAAYNIKKCTQRHWSDELPEGYSLYYLDKSKKVVFVTSEVDALNVRAVKKAFSNDLSESLELVSRAIDLQKNQYSYQIRSIVYLLLELQEPDRIKKSALLERVIEDSTNIIASAYPNKDDFARFSPNANGHFLRGYARFWLKKYKSSESDFDAAFDGTGVTGFYFKTDARLFRSWLACTDGGSYSKGQLDVMLASVWKLSRNGRFDLSNYAKALDDSLNRMKKVCEDPGNNVAPDAESLPKVSKERFLDYLDHQNFRGL